MSKTKSWMTGAIIGGLLGSALVLLYTPAKGSELKNKLQDAAQKFREEVRLAGEEKRAELEAELNSLRSGE
ncbi:MAG TPA: YtxH domain-containing protein [Anaerolineaceae bacterium]|jgi:gas vesicle protein|nr:YtxH domain-containing protein [Anaerolineaceae bacterium]HOR83891.1 YtxH domain-containing protein [Anaerolineaceae bacterium]HPL42227.1 YtxH domain-containing protein [Anaerolineaceae bacterium]HPY32715.1 YtxH domain-containing protein [Anaerolineaceae bacterium]HQC20993.1 YtxH domain-containing protein [Anaerolineaceae bacterium]